MSGSLQRYVVQKCCGNTGHITNFADPDYGIQIAGAIKKVGIHLRILKHTRLMGIGGGNGSGKNDSSSSWGRDPVHPLDTAYATMARKLLEEINEEVVVNSRWPPAQHATAARSSQTRR